MSKPIVFVKIVIFSIVGDKLKIFLKNDKLPFALYDKNITLDRAAFLVFGESINLPFKDFFSEQLYTIFRSDKLSGEIDVIYYFLIPEHKIYSNRKNWCDLNDIKVDKKDREVIFYAVQRLRWKIEYTNVVYSLLPAEFTLSQLQTTYESILGRTLDKRNFRKKIISLNIIKPTGKLKHLVKARPAQVYSFRKKELSFVKII